MSDVSSAGDKSLTPSSTAETDDGDETATDARTARIARNTDGDALGAAVFLDADDLADLGVELDTTDARRVAYTVTDGELRVALAGRGGDGR